jgi:hypothetical protein
MQLATSITEAKFRFGISENEMDLRLSAKDMEDIPSWKDYPSKKYSWTDDKGKKHPNRNPRNAFNKIAMYILFLYDKNSPFHKKHQDIKKKKEMAILESGISPELVDNEEVLEMTVDFLMFQNDKLWTEIVVHESLFSEYTGILLKPMNEAKDKDLVAATNAKQKTREEFSNVRVHLEKLYNEFYLGDKEVLEKANKNSKLSPESISKAIKG